jgi:hypothetical protein
VSFSRCTQVPIGARAGECLARSSADRAGLAGCHLMANLGLPWTGAPFEMTNDIKPVLTAMEGDGFYNRHSSLQAAGIASVLPLWQKMAESVEIDDGPLVIADYGSSQGRNSMAPMRAAIKALRAKAGPDRPVEVIHTDLPSNDFASLFRALHEDPNSYMTGITDVFPSAIGRSYFEPIVAPNRVHLGWNTWTMQWMSRMPVDVPDQMFAWMSASDEVRAAVKLQQAIDWRRFLEARSSEMRRGARLLSAFPGRTAEGTGWEWLCGELWAAVLEMTRAGLLSNEEQRHINLPVNPRTLEEINTPFAETGLFGGLEIEHVEIIKVADPCWNDFQDTGDAKQLAKRHADTTRAWAGPTIKGQISTNHDVETVLEDLFGRFANRLAVAPRPHEPHLAVVVLRKTRQRS